MSTNPEVLWAQRSNATDAQKNLLYLTIRIPDSTHTKINLTATHVTIESDSEDDTNHYSLSLEFFDEVDPDNSHSKTTGNSIFFVIRKKELKEEYWPRLTKQKLKYHFIKTDFDKWLDEDEQNEENENENENENGNPGESSFLPPGFGGDGQNIDLSALQGLDFSGLQNMGGANKDVTEEDFSSSDEEEDSPEPEVAPKEA